MHWERLRVLWHAIPGSTPTRCVRMNIHSLCHLPDQANAVFVGLAQAKDPSRTHADPGVTNSGYGIQSVVVGPRADDLSEYFSLTRQLTAADGLPRGNTRVRCRDCGCTQSDPCDIDMKRMRSWHGKVTAALTLL